MELKDFFKNNNKAAVAFSGGIDSSFLLYEAKKYGADITAYFVNSAFQPEFELNNALDFSRKYNIPLKIVDFDVLSCNDVIQNNCERCYYCKKRIFSLIKSATEKDGYTLLIDGTNASDKETDRPGMAALKELGVVSPLKECGITKEEILLRSKEEDIICNNLFSYSCLATRIPFGEHITKEKLEITEKAEKYLYTLGFRDFRVRTVNSNAKIQLKASQFELILKKRYDVLNYLRQFYPSVCLDLEERK
ncbi:MAG: ATP-dependent sacrificial sulfur transferase LarE [Clostridiales bacterium]|nr:ATP-dependent sacrificial sulfur transferase LarE [Clostridiales bacterium]